MTSDNIFIEQEDVYPRVEDYKPDFTAENSSNSSLLFSFIKSLRIGADLSQISSPIQFEKGKSSLEWGADLQRPLDEIIQLHKLKSPDQRILLLTKFFIAPRSAVPRPSIAGQNKPYNPILGEHFTCHWNHSDNSQTHLIQEQISHHPPITAAYMYNMTNNFVMESTLRMAPLFLGNKFEVSATGPTLFHVFLAPTAEHPDGEKETYEITLPAFCGKGILLGKSGFEISRELKITCQRTGMEASVHFKSGNLMKGEITEQYQREKKGKIKTKTRAIYEIEGSTIGMSYVTDLRNQQKEVFLDVMGMEDLQKVVKPVHKQQEMESRRLWHHVTYALLKEKNFDVATKLKNELEEKQRKKIKEMKSLNQEYVPIHFKKTSTVINKVTVCEYLNPLTKYTHPASEEQRVDDLDLD